MWIKHKLTFFVIYIVYLFYYYLTREHFLNKFIQTTIIFGVVAIGYFIYLKFFKSNIDTNKN